MKFNQRAIYSLVFSSTASVLSAQISVPAGMTYQGRLTGASGTPETDGIGYEVEVRLWIAATDGGDTALGSQILGSPRQTRCLQLDSRLTESDSHRRGCGSETGTAFNT